VLFFSLSTMFAYPYYGVKCLGFVAGAKYGKYYYYFYAASILVAATTQLGVVISLIDLAFGLMAFPTVISSILLAPHVKRAATDYFKRLKDGQFNS